MIRLTWLQFVPDDVVFLEQDVFASVESHVVLVTHVMVVVEAGHP